MNKICFSVLAILGSLIFATGAANADYGKPHSLKTYGSQVESAINQDGSLVAFIIEPDREVTYVRKSAEGSNVCIRVVGMSFISTA